MDKEQSIALEEELEILMDELRNMLAKGLDTTDVEQRIEEIKIELL